MPEQPSVAAQRNRRKTATALDLNQRTRHPIACTVVFAVCEIFVNKVLAIQKPRDRAAGTGILRTACEKLRVLRRNPAMGNGMDLATVKGSQDAELGAA